MQQSNMHGPRGETRVSSGGKRRSQDSIRVLVRIRPLSEKEQARADKYAVCCGEDGRSLQVKLNNNGSNKAANKNFTFDLTLHPGLTQQTVFEMCGIKDLLQSVVEGYSSTVFAFGQTGSGKTYTICGESATEMFDSDIPGPNGQRAILPSDGLFLRSAIYLFDLLSGIKDKQFSVKASYLEIYNETVLDLLNVTNKSLPIRWHAQKGFFVENLFVVECDDVRDLMAVYEEGTKNRKVGSHELNKDSSRSHSMLTVHVEASFGDPVDGHTVQQFGKISFVDLAGSERVKESKSSGERLVETAAINRSLFALGNVISCLGDPRRSGQHVPYRDSKLTKLLQDSLGGNGLTLMITCVSPSSQWIDETLNALKYANRAKNIVNKPLVHTDPLQRLIEDLRKENALLRAENAFLKGINPNHPSIGPPLGGLGSHNSRPLTGYPLLSSHQPHSPSVESPLAAHLPKTSGSTRHGNGGAASPSPAVSGSTSGRYVPVEQVQELLEEYSRENERMKNSLGHLKTQKEQMDRDYQLVMHENEKVLHKLDRLELIFSTRPEVESEGWEHAAAQRKTTPSSSKEGSSRQAAAAAARRQTTKTNSSHKEDPMPHSYGGAPSSYSKMPASSGRTPLSEGKPPKSYKMQLISDVDSLDDMLEEEESSSHEHLNGGMTRHSTYRNRLAASEPSLFHGSPSHSGSAQDSSDESLREENLRLIKTIQDLQNSLMRAERTRSIPVAPKKQEAEIRHLRQINAQLERRLRDLDKGK